MFKTHKTLEPTLEPPEHTLEPHTRRLSHGRDFSPTLPGTLILANFGVRLEQLWLVLDPLVVAVGFYALTLHAPLSCGHAGHAVDVPR